jgi:drug/metabolite transporter (DMT)-like permease
VQKQKQYQKQYNDEEGGITMSSSRMLGLVLVAVGVVLLIFGYNASDAPVEQVRETLTGRYSDQVMWYFVAGIAALVGGALLTLFGRK